MRLSGTATAWPLMGWGLMGAWGLVSLALVVPATPGGATFANLFTTGASIVSCLIIWFADHISNRFAGKPVQTGSPCIVGTNPWPWAITVSACSLINQGAQFAGLPAWTAMLVQAFASFAYIALLCQWFCLYNQSDPQHVESGAIKSVVLSAFICLIALVIPHPLSVVVWAVLPIISAVLLQEARRGHHDIAASELARWAPKTSAPAESREGWRTAIGVVLICGIVTTLPQNLGVVDGVETTRLVNLGGTLASAVISMWYIGSACRIDAGSLLRMLCPLVAISLFLSALTQAGLVMTGLFLGSAAQWALYVFTWVYAAETHTISRRQSAWGTVGRFAATRVAFDLGGFIGAATSLALLSTLTPESSPASFTAGIASGTNLSPMALILFGALATFIAMASPLFRFEVGMGDTDKEDAPPSVSDVKTQLSASSGPDIDTLIMRRSKRFATTYGLSDREAEILALLLCGYSTAAIRNRLAIAKGTVDTYIQRIYRKCDVHSRQELIELVHTFPEAPEP